MSAFINLPYSQQLSVIGGTAPYALSLKSGSLPAGLSMDINGLLSGTPTVLGTSTFTVQAVDGFLGYGEREYSLEIVGGNELPETLVAQGFGHHWLLDEASGDYFDSIGVNTLQQFGTNLPLLYQHPGLVVRGPPRSYGYSNNGSSGAFRIEGSSPPAHNTELTGTMFCAVRANLAGGSQDPVSPWGYSYNSSAVLFHGFRIYNDGRVEYRIQRGSSTESISGISLPGVIVRNMPYILHGVQRADGTGLHIFVNGVDVTDSTSSSGTTLGLDAYLQDLFGDHAAVCTHTTIGSLEGGADVFPGWVSEPAFAPDVALSDDQVMAGFLAAGLDLPASTFEEVMADIVLASDATADGVDYWVSGMHDQSQNRNSPYFSRGSTYLNKSSFDAANLNILVPPADFPGSAYPRYKVSYNAAGTPTMSNASGSAISNADTQGSLVAIIEVTQISISQIYTLFAFGQGFGSNERQVQFSMVGSALGGNLRLEVKDEPNGNLYREVYLAGIQIGDIISMGFVQDGVRGRMFFNGADVTDELSTTLSGTFDESVWLDDIVLTSTSLRVGGIAGSQSIQNWKPNELHDWLWTRRALTPAEVLRMHNGFQGAF